MEGLRRALALVLLAGFAAVLTACGSGRPAPPAIAVVNDQAISQSEYHDYVLYAGRFFAAAGQGRCPGHGSGCAALDRQVLRRLLEQRVVQQYAQAHHITLSPTDQRQIDGQLGVLAAAGSPAGTLLARHQVSRPFLRSVLADELLVQKVERAVLPPRLDYGRSYHLRIVTVPVSAHGQQAAYHAALDLAVSGGAAPAGASDRTEWVAAFRLGIAVQHILAHAQIGQYAGPYPRPTGYRDFQYLGERWGRYGRPARQRLETTFFRTWLDSQLRTAHLACYDGSKRTSCPGSNA